MRIILAFFLLAITACARPEGSQPAVAVSPTPTPTATPVTCNVVDACTYSPGFIPEPVFDCVATTYLAADHPELSAEMNGQTCLTVKEDFSNVQTICEVGPGIFQSCTKLEQGPGPLALPQEGI